MGQSCDHKYRVLSCGRLDAVFPSCVKLVVAKISGIIMRTLKKGGKKMAKAKFQDTLKKRFDWGRNCWKKDRGYGRRRGCCSNQQRQGTA